jgi:formylglycine-generating enzyme required for sulfatase activity
MTDDAFLREVATLQAGLYMLESRSHELCDLADMREIRHYKARLSDYIETHAKAGRLPRDPLQAIEQRLLGVSDFFATADQEFQRLIRWKTDWLKSIPTVSLADLLSARTDLDELIAEVPKIQFYLAQSVSQLDWDASLDLHIELLTCAKCLTSLKLPPAAHTRRNLYQLTRDKGDFTEKIAAHFTSIRLRIEELISLHATHAEALAFSEENLSNDAFRCAEKSFLSLGKGRFSDLDYTLTESRLTKNLDIFAQFADLDSSLDQYFKKNDYKTINNQVDQLRSLIDIKDSELARECSRVLRRIEARLAASRKSNRCCTIKNFIGISILALGISCFAFFASNDDTRSEISILAFGVTFLTSHAIKFWIEARAKAERETTESKAKAECEAVEVRAQADRDTEEATLQAWREAAEAKTRTERETAEARSKLHTDIRRARVGASITLPLQENSRIPFSYCPAGSFVMGSPASEDGHLGDEMQVDVTLSTGFWMAETELTQTQWQAVMGSNPSHFKGDNLPVEHVSWDDAQEFIKKVNGSGVIPGGWKMALPTEAQWEYACRAGDTGAYSGGDINQMAWYERNSSNTTHVVGIKKANAWGLHDMHGNVSEWCADWYKDDLQEGADPSGANSGVRRVSRGGSWSFNASYCRAACRNGHYPGNRVRLLGFRPVLVPLK